MARTRRILDADRQPLYWKAIEAMKEMLAAGEYRRGDLLPSEDVLAGELGISRSTLREAMGHLETEGFVLRRQGIGTYVTRIFEGDLLGGLEQLVSLRDLADEAGLTFEVVERELSSTPATGEHARLLEVEENAELYSLKSTLAVDGRRIAHLDSLIPAALVDWNALQNTDLTILEYLDEIEESDELVPSHTHSSVYSIGADANLASRLLMPEGYPVLNLVELYFSGMAQPITLSYNYFVTDRFNFYITRRIVTKPGRRA